VPVRDEDQIAYSEAIELVARLTAIDNALLLDTDLCVRGFGVQVIESDIPRSEFQHTNPYTDDVHTDDLTTFKGTRHPAGVMFCMTQPREAAAIIASQDGNLSLAVKDAAGSVEVLGSYVRAFGWKTTRRSTSSSSSRRYSISSAATTTTASATARTSASTPRSGCGSG
jgi:hypothetical protein